MQEETVLISLRIPKAMDKDIGYAVKSGRYASRTELLREAVREKLYKIPGISHTRSSFTLRCLKRTFSVLPSPAR